MTLWQEIEAAAFPTPGKRRIQYSSAIWGFWYDDGTSKGVQFCTEDQLFRLLGQDEYYRAKERASRLTGHWHFL